MYKKIINKKVFSILFTLICIALCVFAPMSNTVAQTEIEVEGKTVTYMMIDDKTVPSLQQHVLSDGLVNIYHNGFMLDSMGAPAMIEWHFPKFAEVKLMTRVWQNYAEYTGGLYFRIVHEHEVQGERVNEVIFPADGSWFNVSKNAKNIENAYVIDDYVKVSAGDNIKMICVSMGSDSYCTTYLEGGVNFIYDGGPASGIKLYANDGRIAYTLDGNPITLTSELADYYGSGTSDKVLSYKRITKYIDVVKNI